MSKNFDYLVGVINFAVSETKIAPEFTKSVIQWLQKLDEFDVDPRLPKFFELEGTPPSGERQEVSRTTLEWCKYWYVNEELEFEVKDETRLS